MKVDIIIKNGRVIDPSSHTDDITSVAISKRCIYRIGDCSDLDAAEIIDASGCFVIPGLVDSHVHVFEGGTTGGVCADVVFPCSGVTTGIDAGSAGIANYSIFSRCIAGRSSVPRIKGILNVAPTGLCASKYHVENLDPAVINVEDIVDCVDRYKGEIVGLKIRISKEYVRDYGLKPLEVAIEAGEACKLPVVVHTTNPPRAVEEVLKLLRPGDVFSHVFHGIGHSILDQNGHILNCVWKAKERGVIFDAAGAGIHFSWKTCRTAIDEGFYPQVISSDIFRKGLFNSLVHSFPCVMTKCLAAGMPIEKIIEAVTWNPAKIYHIENECGFLAEGGPADITIFECSRRRPVTFTDMNGEAVVANEVIIPQMTIKDGAPIYRQVDF